MNEFQAAVQAAVQTGVKKEIVKQLKAGYFAHARYAPYVETGTRPRSFSSTPIVRSGNSKERKCNYCASFVIPDNGKCPNCNGPFPVKFTTPERKPEVRTMSFPEPKGWFVNDLMLDFAIIGLILSCIGSVILILIGV